VRAFYDSDGDGSGDFRGLVEKLPYLQDLGVNAIWLLPFYPSPMRDDGYDIADYTDVNPMYGTLGDLHQFIKGCPPARDPRHQRARVQPHVRPASVVSAGAPFSRRQRGSRVLRVERYQPALPGRRRIIFKDFEVSNWTWDHVAGAYYWHRFYSHQPDLNFDNPKVKEAVLKALDFWLESGMDGVRLDAIPYLYEREGTNGENLRRRTNS